VTREQTRYEEKNEAKLKRMRQEREQERGQERMERERGNKVVWWERECDERGRMRQTRADEAIERE